MTDHMGPETTTEYMTMVIPYTSDHECRPGEHGDYEMVCPEAGVLQPFVPFMRRTLLRG